MHNDPAPMNAQKESKHQQTAAGDNTMGHQHAPLRRVLPRGTATNSVDEHLAEHPLLFGTASPSSRGQMAIGPTVSSSSHISLVDSCYSSCSEGEQQHLLLSRETSDSSSSGLGLADELQLRASLEDSAGLDPNLLEFATRLGYSEHSLRTVLAQLGDGEAHQDRVLCELIKLGRQQRHSPQSLTPRRSPSNSPRTAGQQQENAQPPKLRPIVCDGSNIAMTYGNKTVFACRGIRECVQFFVARGHTDILVFVPQFRREQPRSDAPMVDQHILMELEAERRLVWTPSRRVGGRRIVCHDDRYILKTAADKQAIIVSNDEYRDLVKENPQWRAVVENLLLMFIFVDGRFMPPDDPLGRRGPKLNQFLTFAHTPLNAQLCPYAKKCTYGNKCKYFHPERQNGIRLSVTDRLIGGAEGSNNNGCAGAKQSLTARPSLIAEHSLTSMPGSANGGCLSPQHANVGRTRSLNLPPEAQKQSLEQREEAATVGPGGPLCRPSRPVQPKGERQRQPRSLFPFPPPPFSSHPSLLRFESSPAAPSPRLLDRHPPVSRIVSAPAPTQHMFAPSSAVWGECEFSLSAGAGKAGLQQAGCGRERGDEQRDRLQYHLCQLFPEATVLAVMASHPHENDAQKLCQRIIAFQKGFADAHQET